MVFSYQVTTPSNTSKETPLVTPLKLAKGVLHRWVIFFPAGHQGECKIRLQKGGEFVLPTNPNSFILGDDFTFEGDEFLVLGNEPYSLQAHSWNDDLINNHTIYLHIFLKPLWTFFPFSDKMLQLLEDTETMKVL